MSSPSVVQDKHRWARDLLKLDLSGERWRVLYAVKEIHRDGVAVVQSSTIAAMTGLNRRTVSRHLKAAEIEQLIAVDWSKGGSSPHRIRLLDPTATTGLLRQHGCRSGNRDNCDTLPVAVTATPTRARVSDTLTLPSGAAQAAPTDKAASVSNVEIRRDLSVSSATPKGASETESDNDGWFSSPAEDARRADLIAGRLAVDLPATASETIDDDDAAHSWMSQLVDRAIARDGEEQIRREIDALVMAAVHEGDDRALDAEDWLLRTATAELTRRRAAGTGRVGDLPSNNSPLAAHLEEKARG